ncbi:MAG: hypothetical protein J5772_05585 [Clostridia bacterium]|nr:hypothetical protein [Clostridia bacterium]
MRRNYENASASALAYAAELIAFNALPLFRHAFSDPFAAARWLYFTLPYCVFPAAAFVSGFALCFLRGYRLSHVPLTAAALMPAALIFYRVEGLQFALPVGRLLLICLAASLAGLHLAFPLYAQRRLGE